MFQQFSLSISRCGDARTAVTPQPCTSLPVRRGDRLKANRKQDKRKGNSATSKEMRGRINLKPTLIFGNKEERVDLVPKCLAMPQL